MSDDSAQLVRLWVNGEDFGTMTATAAATYRAASSRNNPCDVIHAEPVPDDSPVFLPSPQTGFDFE